MVKATRTHIILEPDSTRVLFRPFGFTDERALKVVGRVLSLPEEQVRTEIRQVLAEFGPRHQKLAEFFLRRFDEMRRHLLTDQELSKDRKLLIGAYFTQEYSLEAAALFNPSIVWHPNQSDLPENCRRFVVSLRATGEGHISSITFRSGLVDAAGQITINQPTRFVTTPEAIHSIYEKPLFEKKLGELGLANEFTAYVMSRLEETFTLVALEEAIRATLRRTLSPGKGHQSTAQGILSLAQSNYQIEYAPEQRLSERVIFPYTPTERKGIEDARFVQFHDDEGQSAYYATYTAYDGEMMLPQLLETEDFLRFKISTLNGPAVQNKGMALFPRKINGYYAMLSRQDNENVYFMISEHLHFWYEKHLVARPTFSWEFVQLGNCGPPIETEAGWLVLTHGVGPMRKYSMGAFLLDRNDPTRLIGRTVTPILTPNENEREGYVPNVVYSCGGVVYGDKLIIPYAMADYASSFATIDLPALLEELTPS